MPWHRHKPRRFAVQIETQRGEEHSYSVATWRSEAKAVALAVTRHRALGRGHVFDISTHGLGTVTLDGDGKLTAPEEDLVDRYEW